MGHFIVAHDLVSGAVTEDGGATTLSRGELAEKGMFPAKGAWDRLVRIGAVKEGTQEEVKLGEARRLQNEAMEQMVPGHPDLEKLSVQRAVAERNIAEPAARPAVEPEEAAEVAAEAVEAATAPSEPPARFSGRRG